MAHVLVVDDDAVIRNLLRQVLERVGYHVTEARNGCEGLQRYCAASPDVVITDILMAKMSGLELIAALRRGCPTAKIIGISGSGPQVLALAKQKGALHVFPKPFQPQEILDAVHALVQHQG